ncbi:hypothetical protein [Paramaledivibacter caminithermalis]|uniref:hypothetical protein n=1 Tax=Paramaledivibacter caminithermalis TaxID=191027 RepID=UPI0009344A41|nr:hypothetical protein [Paramaledivibacter caminithermalis]
MATFSDDFRNGIKKYHEFMDINKRITNLNRMGTSFISEFLFSVILITLSLNLFIISWLMCQYDKNKME